MRLISPPNPIFPIKCVTEEVLFPLRQTTPQVAPIKIPDVNVKTFEFLKFSLFNYLIPFSPRIRTHLILFSYTSSRL